MSLGEVRMFVFLSAVVQSHHQTEPVFLIEAKMSGNRTHARVVQGIDLAGHKIKFGFPYKFEPYGYQCMSATTIHSPCCRRPQFLILYKDH